MKLLGGEVTHFSYIDEASRICRVLKISLKRLGMSQDVEIVNE